MTEFQLLDIWSKFHRKVIISFYTDSRASSNESTKTERSIHGAETSWKLKARPAAYAMSHLMHLAWENVTTNDRRHMWQASMFLLIQATHMLAISRHTADYTTGKSRVTGDGSGIQMTWSSLLNMTTLKYLCFPCLSVVFVFSSSLVIFRYRYILVFAVVSVSFW